MIEPGRIIEPGREIALGIVGRDALRCLEGLADHGGSVLAVFRRSVYLADGRSGDLACLGPPGLGGGPLNALAARTELPDWQAGGLRQGDRVEPGGLGFRIGTLGAVDIAAAAPYDPPCGPYDWTEAGLDRALQSLARLVPNFGRADGLAPLAVPVGRRGLGDPGSNPLIDTALAGIAEMEAWLVGPARTGPPAAAIGRLLGLGPGLTPSGDDFIGGMMIALRLSGHGARADGIARPTLARARRATNRISAAHLTAAARGQGAAALHLTIDALARMDAAALDEGLRGLDRIGHSSGWDALAGAVCALDGLRRGARGQGVDSPATISAAPALDAATTTPAARSTPT